PRQAVRPQRGQFESGTKPQRNLKFKGKNRLSKFNTLRKQFSSQNQSRLRQNQSQHLSPLQRPSYRLVTANPSPRPTSRRRSRAHGRKRKRKVKNQRRRLSRKSCNLNP